MQATQLTPRRRRLWLRRGAILTAIVLALVVARPAIHLLRTAWLDRDDRLATPPGSVDDASRLNATPVAEVWPVPADPRQAETQLAELLARARREGLHVSIAGTRHSMGGHTIYPGGIVVDMLPFHALDLDTTNDLLHAQAGATWKQIIAYLDPRGRSVAVMQSDNSFSVGGSISVNCHGWQYDRPPIASTVESFRLMQADGSIARCSRRENAELFSLALGGYGLFGIVLDVDLRVVPNQRYRVEQQVQPTEQALRALANDLKARGDVEMAYARLAVARDKFLEEAILNVFHRDPSPDGKLPPLGEPGMASLRRTLFRGSAENDYGKWLRWSAETRLQPRVNQTYFSRNQLLNEDVAVFQNRSAASTDILHEYFVPPEGTSDFIKHVRWIVPAHHGDLLNVTVRYVDTDRDTLLRYADRPLLSLVMLFIQPTTEEGDKRMQAMTQELIDAALAAGGRYYLPYRLHATSEQFTRAYPMAGEFFARKRHYDPEERFQNRFYEKYGKSRQPSKLAP